jgi:hypothetical protein
VSRKKFGKKIKCLYKQIPCRQVEFIDCQKILTGNKDGLLRRQQATDPSTRAGGDGRGLRQRFVM